MAEVTRPADSYTGIPQVELREGRRLVLTTLAYEVGSRREALEVRLAMTVQDAEDLIRHLQHALARPQGKLGKDALPAERSAPGPLRRPASAFETPAAG